MNEPIKLRHVQECGGQYACWVKGHQREPEGRSYEWLHWRASPRLAAQAFADDLADHGTHPELVGQEFEICVRDKRNGSLSTFTIAWEVEPMPFVRSERQVEAGAGGVGYG